MVHTCVHNGSATDTLSSTHVHRSGQGLDTQAHMAPRVHKDKGNTRPAGPRNAHEGGGGNAITVPGVHHTRTTSPASTRHMAASDAATAASLKCTWRCSWSPASEYTLRSGYSQAASLFGCCRLPHTHNRRQQCTHGSTHTHMHTALHTQHAHNIWQGARPHVLKCGRQHARGAGAGNAPHPVRTHDIRIPILAAHVPCLIKDSTAQSHAVDTLHQQATVV